jgi:hypothetical protein
MLLNKLFRAPAALSCHCFQRQGSRTMFQGRLVLISAGTLFISSYHSTSDLENSDSGRRGSAALTMRHPLYPQKLALTSPTSGGRSVDIVCSRIKVTELVNHSMSHCSNKRHSPPSRAKVKNRGAIPPLSRRAWCLANQAQGQLYICPYSHRCSVNT